MNAPRGSTGAFSLEIGKRIRRLREVMDISQQELEELTGIGFTIICNYEKGRSNIPLNKLELIAKALKINPHVLCGPLVDFLGVASPRVKEGLK